MFDSDVDLVEEHVDLGGSRFSESIIERWHFARVSQRNVICDSPGIRESMSASILSRIVSLSVLSVLASWQTSGSSCIATVCLSVCPDLSWVWSTLRLLLSSDEHVWTTITSCVIPSCPDLSRIGFGVGWVGWKNLVCRTTPPSGCWTTYEPNSLVFSWCTEIFGGGRGDMDAFSFKTSPVFSLTTLGIQ